MISLGISIWSGAAGIGTAGFSPASLFAAGEQGVWYDPSDLSTLFQDAFGNTPVTAAGQPVGLILDKSRGSVKGPDISSLGVEKQGGLLTRNGFLDFTTTATTFAYLALTIPINQSAYMANFSWEAGGTPGGTSKAFVWNEAGLALLGSGPTHGGNGTFTESVYVPAGSSSIRVAVQLNGVIGATCKFTVEVRELPGNHATQGTAASRPILREENGVRYLETDGVDDNLVVAGFRSGVDWASGCAARKTASGGRFLFEVNPSAANNYLGGPDNSIAVNSPPAGQGTVKTIAMNTDFSYVASITGDNLGSVDMSLFCRFDGAARSFYFGGRTYGLLLINKALNADQQLRLEQYMNAKRGG